MELRTLLLNTWGLPHAVLSWEEAVTLMYLEKVDVREEYNTTVSSPSVTYFIPAVLQLRRAFYPHKKGVRYSRDNIFARDGYKCQYCGERKSSRELNLDHVIPRRQGGKTCWDNVTTSCYLCNNKKGARTPEQAGMKLLRKPVKPHSLPLHMVLVEGTLIPSVWIPYLESVKTKFNEDGFI
jgi:5-methylcytosine-specific restriction endonuclease McrA